MITNRISEISNINVSLKIFKELDVADFPHEIEKKLMKTEMVYTFILALMTDKFITLEYQMM